MILKTLVSKWHSAEDLSFNLNDVMIPVQKVELVKKAHEEVEEVRSNYNMGFITNNERYNQIIDIWTRTNSRITENLMKQLIADQTRIQCCLYDAWIQEPVVLKSKFVSWVV